MLKADDDTKGIYPFDFELHLTYTLRDNQLFCGYRVLNRGKEKMYFCIGGHPAFNVPFEAGEEFTDYKVEMRPLARRSQLALKGAYLDIDNPKKTVRSEFMLNHDLFNNDALIFETTSDTTITLSSKNSTHKVVVNYADMPFVGIWSPYPAEAPFVCIEPWCGVADTLNATGELKEKFGINELIGGLEYTNYYCIKVE